MITINILNRVSFILIVFIYLSILASCKKDTKSEPDNGFSAPVNTDLYAYAYFKPGTYWVYQDSISGILDSVYVTFANKGTYTNGDAEVAQGLYRGTFSWFTCDAISSYDHYKYQNWMDQSYEVNGSAPTVYRERYIMPGSGNQNGKTINVAIVKEGKSLGVSSDYVTYLAYFNTFSLSTFVYPLTQKWINYGSNCDDDQNTKYYIAKNIGIVRREQLDSNRTWNLIRYNIIQ